MKSNWIHRIGILIITSVAAFAILACAATPTTESSGEATVAPMATEAPVATPAAVEEPITETPAVDTATDTSAESAVVANTKINLNDMTADQLLNTIPNFSQRFVREFFEYQPYISIQQFRREMSKYVDDSQISAWEAYVYVPVNVNESDAATLMQIPGVDESIANQLIDARPYGSNDAFLQTLAEYLSAAEASAAAGYLAP